MAVEFTPTKDYLYIDVNGVWDLETAKITQNNAMELMGKHDLSKLILDISKVENQFTFPEVNEINMRVPEIFPPHFIHAIIFSYDVFSKLEIEYTDTMSFNRGVNIKLFKKFEAAEEWLLKQT
ncbi:MAG: hypothetical protein JJ895_11995 [Balneolaceae bacterium]|nr:hypothetical protein [Balneolaceae bacterium]